MKKLNLLVAAVILSVASMAQAPVSFGIRAGATSARLSGEAVNTLQNLLDFSGGLLSTENRTGMFAGGFVNIPLGEKFSIEPAVYYSQKGYALSGGIGLKGMDFLGVNAKAQLNTSYIDLPVVAKVNINGLQVFAGPQVSYLTGASLRTTAGALGFNVVDFKTDATGQFNRWDAGITGGVGYAFGNGLNLSAAYDHGMMKADAGESFGAYNRVIKVGVGYRF